MSSTNQMNLFARSVQSVLKDSSSTEHKPRPSVRKSNTFATHRQIEYCFSPFTGKETGRGGKEQMDQLVASDAAAAGGG